MTFITFRTDFGKVYIWTCFQNGFANSLVFSHCLTTGFESVVARNFSFLPAHEKRLPPCYVPVPFLAQNLYEMF